MKKVLVFLTVLMVAIFWFVKTTDTPIEDKLEKGSASPAPVDSSEKKTRKIAPPFNVEPPEVVKVASDLSCNEATNAINAYSTYRSVQILLQQKKRPINIEYLSCFLAKEKIRDSAEETLTLFRSSVFNNNVMYAYLSHQLDNTLLLDIQSIDKRKGSFAWSSGLLGLTAQMAYERTEEKRFVDLYVDYLKKVMQLRDSQLGLHDDYHGRVMDSWGARNIDSKYWVAHITHFSVIMRPATKLALVIKNNSILSEHIEFANEIVNYFDSAYREFDVDLKPAKGTDEIWYWRPLDEKFEATNHLHVQGQALLNMYALTGDEFYADRVRWIIRVFEKGVSIDEKGFIAWNYHPYLQVEKAMSNHNALHYSERVWKAGLTIPFIYQADAAGFSIDPRILEATTYTIHSHILANNGLAINLHPKGSIPIEQKTGKVVSRGRRASIIQFLSAAVKEPRIREQVLEIVSSRRDIFQKGWLSHHKMANGYAHFLNRISEK